MQPPTATGAPPPSPDPLPVEQRSCLLRAGRRQLLELEKELERHKHLDARYGAAVVDATQAEMDCLQAGIAWLWRNPGV